VSRVDFKQTYSRLGVWLLFVFVCLWVIATSPPLQTNLTQFLPDKPEQNQLQLIKVLEQGAGSRLLIVQLSADTIQLATDASKKLKAGLDDNPHFLQVLNGSQLISSKDVNRLLKYRYLVSDETDFSVESLRTHFKTRLMELASPMSLLEDQNFIRSDPTASARSILQKLQDTSVSPDSQNSVWYSDEYNSALLLVYLRAATHELNHLQRAVDEIHMVFKRLNQHNLLKLNMTGAPVFALQSRELIRGEAEKLSVWGSLGVIFLLYFMFRSVAVVLLAVLPMASGILAGMSAVILLFGSLHGITLVFGITLIGISVDYPIHLFSHLQAKQLNEAKRHVWKTLVIGALTTATGFAALLFSDFSALAQLAVFSCAGILSALIVTRFLLPVLVNNIAVNIRFEKLISGKHLAGQTFSWLPVVPFIFVLISGTYLLIKKDTLWEKDISKLTPISEQSKQMDKLLRNELNAPDTGRQLVIQADSLEQLLQKSEKLEIGLDKLVKQNFLKHYVLPSMYLPSIQTQLKRQSQLPERDELVGNLELALMGLAFKKDLFDDFVNDVIESKILKPVELADLKQTIFHFQLKQLIFNTPQNWFALVSLSGIKDEKKINDLAGQYGDGFSFLNISKTTSSLVDNYRAETIRLSLAGAVVIFLVLFFTTGRFMAFRVILPVVAAVISTVTLLSLSGIALSLFHIAALLLVLGLGLDYSLFINRTGINTPLFVATALSLLVCNISTVLVFALLASSSVPILSAMGLTVVVGAVLSLLFSSLMVQVN